MLNGRMRFLLPIGGILLLLLLYTIYWLYMSAQIREEIARWVARQEAAGYVVERESVRVSGYPYRFQVQVQAPRIEVPEAEGGWNAALTSLRANALPYDLSHWIVAFDGPLRLDGYSEPGARLELDAEEARISLVYNASGETTRIGVDLTALRVAALSGPAPAIQAIDRLLLNGVVQEDNRLHLRSAVNGVTTAPGVLEPDMVRAFGATAALARLDVEITEWASLARSGNTLAWSAAGGVMQILDAELEWGPAHITGTGDLTLDNQARPDGRLSLRITDPDALADALVRGGLVPRENEQALRLAAMLAPRGPEGVSLPFRLQNGSFYLGPVRLGSLERSR